MIHEEDGGGFGFPAVASGMLYGFIREGPLRAAKTMRMILNAKGPRATKIREAMRQSLYH